MSMKLLLNSLDLNPRILDALKKTNIKVPSQILSYSLRDLVRTTRLSCSDVKKLQLEAAKYFLSSPIITALDLTQDKSELHKQTFTTGCQVIDAFLKGGIRSHLITEVTGESAAGKTQFCFQLCITVQLCKQWSGLNAGVVYISTESLFSSKRLVAMADRLKKRTPELNDFNFTDNVFIEHCADFENLQFCLECKVPRLCKVKRIGLLVVDSVAAVLRGEQTTDGKTSVFERSKKIFSIINSLQKIMSQHNMAVVLVNQVVDTFAANKTDASSINGKSPALGMAWSSMMNNRICLSRSQQSVPILQTHCSEDGVNIKTGSTMANVRKMTILSSPYLANDSFCKFIVDEEGVKGIQEIPPMN